MKIQNLIMPNKRLVTQRMTFSFDPFNINAIDNNLLQYYETFVTGAINYSLF